MTEASRRPVLQREYVGGIDGLRGLAALLVLVFHCWAQSGQPGLDGSALRDFVGGGYFGVDLFFVISGFVLFLPMVRRGTPGSGRAYALRRTGRMLPAYFVTIAACVLFRSYLKIDVSHLSFLSWRGLSHLVMLETPVLGHSNDLGFGVAGQIWTLSNEMIFYVVLFFVASSFSRRPMWGLVTTFAIALGWRALVMFGVHDSELKYDVALQVPAYAAHFGLGMLVAVIHARQPAQARDRFARLAPGLAVAATATAVVLITRSGMRGFTGQEAAGDHHLRNLGIATCFALLLLCVANGPAGLRRLLDAKPLRWLGEVSYGLYLFHLPIIGFALWCLGQRVPVEQATNEGFFTLMGWALPASCLVAWASYVFLETPIRQRARILAKRYSAR